QILDAVQIPPSERALWQMYQADALRLTGDCTSAMDLYEKLISNPTFRDAAEWRQILCGFALGKREEVYDRLQEIAEKDHYRSVIAKEMLKNWE
ncbi:MAG: hypothetical protein AAFR59_10435, partial [Bacteroidota bacterium]